MLVTIEYVDGSRSSFSPEDWPYARADGVYEVIVTNKVGSVQFKGKSMYWCRRDGQFFVFGAASFYVDCQGPEVAFCEESQLALPSFFRPGAPDLEHRQVKLGWWRGEVME